jgi:hypothetical protein
MKLRLATVAALAAVAATASPASAGVTCQTDAAAAVAGAAVNGPRQGWTPPVWTFDMPSMSMSVDVQADTLSEAQDKARAYVQSQVDAACSAEQQTTPQGDTTSGAASATTPASYPQASELVASAPIQYVGNSWGPLPMWRLTFASINLSVDVQAADEASARTAVIATVARVIGEAPTSDPAPTETNAQVVGVKTDPPAPAKTVTAGSWSGLVDAGTGIPVAAGIPQ